MNLCGVTSKFKYAIFIFIISLFTYKHRYTNIHTHTHIDRYIHCEAKFSSVDCVSHIQRKKRKKKQKIIITKHLSVINAKVQIDKFKYMSNDDVKKGTHVSHL